MGLVTDFTSLCNEVATYLGRSDVASMVPGWINLLEKRLNRDLRLQSMEAVTTFTTSAGVNSFTLPANRVAGSWDVFLEMRDLTLTGSPPSDLPYMTPDAFNKIDQTVPGQPRNATIIGGTLYVAPSPDGAYTVSMTYYREIPPLTSGQPTNAVIVSHPDIYLYGTLLESVPWTRASAPAEIWAQYFTEAKKAAMDQEKKARFTPQFGMRPIRKV